MPRYFFNILDRDVSGDDTGTECPDIYAAQAEAVRTSGQMLQEMAEDVYDGREWVMEVSDDHGLLLFVVRLSIEDRMTYKPKTIPITPD